MATPERPVFRSEWVVEINEMLYNDDENSQAFIDEDCRPKEDAILRVATPLQKTKPEAYIPQFVSIGPYHHSTLDKDYSFCAGRKISTAQTRKGKAAARLSKKLRECGNSFESVVKMIENMQPKIESFYHLPNNSSTTEEEQFQKTALALMMAVDSSFLLRFLIGLYESREKETAPADDRRPSSWRPNQSLHDEMIELGPLEVCIKSDILKLENQIPLTVLNGVFKYAKEASIYRGLPEDLNQLLHKTCATLSSFKFEVSYDEYIKLSGAATVENQPHLLAYMHAFLSPFLQVKQEDQDADLCTRIKFHILNIHVYILTIIFWKWNSPSFERKYEITLNAEKLAKNGIKFKPMSVSEGDKMIRFDSWSGTLYLPWINVTEMQTEVLLRNMLAWEFNHVSRGTSVIDYVGLMQCLIQTPQDVRVLRDRRVIESTTLTDESIAKMWNDLARPFFTGSLGPHSDDLGRQLYFVLHKKFHETKIKRMLGGLYDYVSNWKFIGFVAGFLGLALTATQTYFTVYPRSPSSPPPP